MITNIKTSGNNATGLFIYFFCCFQLIKEIANVYFKVIEYD